MKTYAIIPSGGQGNRAGFKIPKQYVKIGGKEILVYTIEVLQRNKLIDEIIIAAKPEHFKLINKLISKYRLSKVTSIVPGGKERQDSVFSALKTLKAGPKDLVLVHDAARPLLEQSVLNASIEKARSRGNAVVGIRARDTLVHMDKTKFSYPDRSNIYYIQTPQIFRYKILMDAMLEAKNKNISGTDESFIVSALGYKIHLVEGSPLNFKVTTREDIRILGKILSKKQDLTWNREMN